MVPRRRINTRGKSSLHDLYRRVPKTKAGAGQRTTGTRPKSRQSLSNRYDTKLRKDLNRVAPGGGTKTKSPRGERSNRTSTRERRPADRPRTTSSKQRGDSSSTRGIATTPGRQADRRGNRDSSGGRKGGGLTPRTRRGASDRYTSPGAQPRNDRRASPRVGPNTRVTGTTGNRGRDRLAGGGRNRGSDRYRGRSTPSSHYGPNSYYSPSSYYNGYANWHGHSLGLSFSFGYTPSWCRWGLYSYPYYYCSYWPNWYSNYRYGFGVGWNSYYPSYGYSSSWWPSSYYQPSVYVSHHYYDDDEEGSYYSTSYGDSSVTVHEGESAGSSEETVSAGRPAVSPPSEVSLADHHVSLGDFYFKEGRFQEAAESYLRALAYAPDDATIHFVLADALFSIGDYHYAAYMIGKGLSIDPELASADADKRTFYTDVKDFEKQMATLRAYVEEKPYDAAAQIVLGYNLNFSKQPAEASQVFRRVLEIHPKNEVAEAFLAVLDSSKAESEPAKAETPKKRSPY